MYAYTNILARNCKTIIRLKTSVLFKFFLFFLHTRLWVVTSQQERYLSGRPYFRFLLVSMKLASESEIYCIAIVYLSKPLLEIIKLWSKNNQELTLIYSWRLESTAFKLCGKCRDGSERVKKKLTDRVRLTL